MLIQISIDNKSLVVAISKITCKKHTRQVETILSIIDIQLIVKRPAVDPLVSNHRPIVYTEAFAGHLLGDDADNSLY